MRATLRRGYKNMWAMGLAFSLILLVACWPTQGPEGGTRGVERDAPRRWSKVTVDQGRLSVDLRQADIHTVLAQIGKQVGIPILIGAIDRKTVSVEFTDVELERGLRRLLRLASLSHTILYAQGPAGTVAMRAVHVFGEGKGEATPQPIIAEREVDESAEDAGQRFAAALMQAQAASPPSAGGEESEAARRFREALERAREQPPQPSGEQESDAARRFREALERSLKRGEGIPPSANPAGEPQQKSGESGGAGSQ